MNIIIDNNILFSLMKPGSGSSKIFSSLNCEFVAPSFVIQEFNKYEEECLKKSGLSIREFKLRKKEIFSKINFFEFSEYDRFLKEALKICSDQDDAPYMALALKLKTPIWSNDSALKQQDKVMVLSTKDLIELIF